MPSLTVTRLLCVDVGSSYSHFFSVPVLWHYATQWPDPWAGVTERSVYWPDIEKSPAEATDAAVAGGIQSRARRRNCRHSNSAPTGPEAPAKAGSSGLTKMQELAGNGSPPSIAASPANTSQNWPPPVLGARPAIAVQGGIR